MWYFWVVSIFLFYLFAVLQNSFLVHSNFFSIVPNLVFIFFFLLTYFSAYDRNLKRSYRVIIFAIVAGLFIDIFSSTHLGVSIIILIIVGLAAKKMQFSLLQKKEKYSISQFLSLFLIWLIVYELLFAAYLRFINPMRIPLTFNWATLLELSYNLLWAAIGFYIFKFFKFHEKRV
jgi:rod shape-determining protein MreD